jgi:hypothetical protein
VRGSWLVYRPGSGSTSCPVRDGAPLIDFRISTINYYAILLGPGTWHISAHAVTAATPKGDKPNLQEPAMIRSLTPRIDWAVSLIAAVCLLGPMLMGIASSLATSI